MTDFSTLSLSAPVLRAIEEQGFTTTTEIQAATIPALMTGQDVIGISQTGGGKTAAFVLPMIERLMAYEDKPKSGMPRALILAPTRELALQISETVKADRMLDMGFVDDVRLVAAKMMSDHQSVMFSATMNGGIRTLANTLLKNPAQIEVAREATIADNLSHKVMFVPYDKKRDLLLHMIETKKVTKSLIFVRTKREADELADFMAATGFSAESIHGDKQQRQRVQGRPYRFPRGNRRGSTRH